MLTISWKWHLYIMYFFKCWQIYYGMTEQEIVNIVLGQSEVEDNEGVDKISEPIVTNTEAINGWKCA